MKGYYVFSHLLQSDDGIVGKLHAHFVIWKFILRNHRAIHYFVILKFFIKLQGTCIVFFFFFLHFYLSTVYTQQYLTAIHNGMRERETKEKKFNNYN